MSTTLDAATDPNTDPNLVAALAEVQRTFDNMRAANARVARSSKPASLAAARRAARLAERAYRDAADRRDELVEIRNARMTQRGDERGALWSKPDGVGVDAPVVKLPERATVKVTVRFARSDEFPYTVVLEAGGERAVHRFADSTQRQAFIDGAIASAKIAGTPTSLVNR